MVYRVGTFCFSLFIVGDALSSLIDFYSLTIWRLLILFFREDIRLPVPLIG